MMKLTNHRALWILTALVLATLLGLAKPIGADEPKVKVSLPIHGQFAFSDYYTSQVLLLDTYTGDTHPLVTYDDGGTISDLVWSPQGNLLSYYHGRGSASTIFNLATNSPEEVPSFPTFSGTFKPMGWSNDGTNLLYYNLVLGAPGNGSHKLLMMDRATKSLTYLLGFEEGQLLSDIPLPSGVKSFRFSRFQLIRRNPVYDYLAMLQIIGSGLENNADEVPSAINILWNFSTGQMALLDGIFDDPILTGNALFWSPDGQDILAITLHEGESTTHIVRLLDGSEDSVPIEPIASASNGPVVLYWLGVDDLLITTKSGDDDTVFDITQIVDGTWQSVEFLRFPSDQFPIIQGDWHLTASDEEKQALACLFGHAPDGGTCDNQSG